jgi:UDP-N-acetylglucosamine--N-acetylmuramyl-(pentapeptide) pyrophosphoryl-undecaprenol N-acetylglucosamine transferase
MTHQVREEQIEAARAAYAACGVKARVESFFTDMHEQLAQAHLAIARAGASTVTELAIAGRPSILVPLAIAMDDHQTVNAEGMVTAGAADIVMEDRFAADSLTQLLVERLSSSAMLAARAKVARSLGRPNAARDLADLAEEAAGVTVKAHAQVTPV